MELAESERSPDRNAKKEKKGIQLHRNCTEKKNPLHSPLKMKTTPANQARIALVLPLPLILVHFIPTRATTEPNNPRQTAAIISTLHA